MAENGENVDEKTKPLTGQHREGWRCVSGPPSSSSPLTHKEVVAVILCGAGQRSTSQGGGPLWEGWMQTQGNPLFHPLWPSYHYSLLSAPSVSCLHLPDGRSSSSVCRHFHLFPFDMAFYLRSNSHHFNQDRITLGWLPVHAALPLVHVCACPSLLLRWRCASALQRCDALLKVGWAASKLSVHVWLCGAFISPGPASPTIL